MVRTMSDMATKQTTEVETVPEVEVRAHVARDQYAAAMIHLTNAFAELHRVARTLPILPTTGCPDHGWDEMRIEERGYARWTELRHVEDDNAPRFVAISDGWDDMSEDADGPEVAICGCCDQVWRRPTNLEWH